MVPRILWAERKAVIAFDDCCPHFAAVAWCLRECEAPTRDYELSRDALDELAGYLREMLAIPESDRDCVPADYDGEHPENFPPVGFMAK